MPYIDRKTQIELDNRIKIISTPGELTYAVTKSIQQYIFHKIEENGRYRYEDLAACLGALEGAKIDLVRRIIDPYEIAAQAKNGDVWPETFLP
jgi:hypothetical protein